ADGDLSGGGTRDGVGKILDILLGGLKSLDFENQMSEPRPESAVFDHIPGTESNRDFAVGDVIAVVPRQAFDRLEFENFLVILSEVRRTRAANSDVIDPARLLPAFLEVAFAHVGHALLGEVELVVIRIVGSKTGEGNVTLALDHKNVGIKLLQPVSDGLHVVHLQAEVIEAGGKTRLALQQGEAHHTA